MDRARHEKHDMKAGGMALGLGIVAALVVLSALASWWFYGDLRSGRGNPETVRAAVPPPVPAGPRLQADPSRDWEDLHREWQRELSTWGPIEGEKDRVRMPVERAMEAVLRDGLPVRETKEER